MRATMDPPGKEQSFLFISNNKYCAEIKYFHFNVMGLGINMLHTIKRPMLCKAQLMYQKYVSNH